MTEEQIKQEAKKHADAYATPDLEDSFRVYIYEANKDGYIAGATEATKELEAQIEKRKSAKIVIIGIGNIISVKRNLKVIVSNIANGL